MLLNIKYMFQSYVVPPISPYLECPKEAVPVPVNCLNSSIRDIFENIFRSTVMRDCYKDKTHVKVKSVAYGCVKRLVKDFVLTTSSRIINYD